MDQYKKVIQKYNSNPEYVNPNCSLSRAKEILNRLEKEYYLSYGKNDLEL